MRVPERSSSSPAAGSGIGAGLASTVLSRRERPPSSWPTSIWTPQRQVAEGIDGHALQVDVADEDSNRRLIEDVEANFGPIDLFCANAGIASEGDEQSPDDEWDRMWGINFKAHVFAARHLIPLWIGPGRRLPAGHRFGRRTAEQHRRGAVHRDQTRRGGLRRMDLASPTATRGSRSRVSVRRGCARRCSNRPARSRELLAETP